MRNVIKFSCLKVLLIRTSLPFLSAGLLTAGFAPLHGAEKDAGAYYSEALESIAEGDSARTLRLLDKALEIDPKHGLSLLARGSLYLEQGNIKKARRDFNIAKGDKDPAIRARGYVGRGDILRRMSRRNWQAVEEYRMATLVDPSCREAYYAIAETGFELIESTGYRTAGAALAKLVCLDPEYRDAFKLWWEKIRDQSDDELRRVDRCLEDYIAQRPEKSAWWLELAQIRFRLGETGRAAEALEKLEEANPAEKASERLLLQARCLLESGDTLGFENNYGEALKEAEKDGGFTHFLLEAEPIFHPEETEKAGKLLSATEWANFFRVFWKRRDPDPISSNNERLVTHYLRLREAEKQYLQLNPHSLFQTSRSYHRMISPRAMAYHYDPDIFFDRSHQLSLDARGLLYLRHGPPDQIRREFSEDPIELWVYGATFYCFEKSFGAGDFTYFPVNVHGVGDIEHAMQTESFRDPLPALEQDYYGTDFKGPGGLIEIEFYQSVPVEATLMETGLEAAVAVYDSTWMELVLDRTISKKVKINNDSLWLAVNKVSIKPGKYFYVVRMDVPGHRAVSRKVMSPWPYSKWRLDVSGIILGSTPIEGQPVHQRRGVDILPRPSLSFYSGENIMVYLEVYNLQKDRQGGRSFNELVTVSLLKEKAGIIKRLFRGKKPARSLTLTFDRHPSETIGPVAEHFDIDTSALVPGSYRLTIEVRDKNSRYSGTVSLNFELEPYGK